MRISDWSSDVCSSDLSRLRVRHPPYGPGMGLAGVDEPHDRRPAHGADPAGQSHARSQRHHHKGGRRLYQLAGQALRACGGHRSGCTKVPVRSRSGARLMGQVASHEMGHNLGLKDGSYGKGVYTVAQVREPAWVQRNGFAPSIMNYSRMNYVAQPEDNMPSELLIQQVGPADRYWIKVLYQVFPDVHSVQDEAAPMDALLRQLETRPERHFNEGN